MIGTNTSSERFEKCKEADRDVVCHHWLAACLQKALEDPDPAADPPELEPVYMLHVSEWLREQFLEKFDIFGDSYTKQLSQSSFDALLDREVEPCWDIFLFVY